MNATKERLGPEDALEIVNKHDKLVVARGKRVMRFDLKKERPEDEEILKYIMGPSGNLRAPSWTLRKTLVVGFHEDAYAELLG